MTDNKINLDICVPGQKVRLKDGTIVEYQEARDTFSVYRHSIGPWSYTNNGNIWRNGLCTEKDVAEILPIEEEPVKLAEVKQSTAEQLDVSEPDHVSIIPQPNGVLISIKKDNTLINWRHYNS